MSPSPLPLPLRVLRLSSPSFLETILTDAGNPVYSTETTANTTILSRCHPLHGLSLVATILWPEQSTKGKAKDFPHPRILMDGSSMSEDDLLRRNVLNTSRKFHIPGHSHSLKWRRVQGVFQCTSASGTLVAVFEPAILTACARLSLFVDSLPGLPDHHSSDLLTSYLIVTALLLLTHPEDWRGFSPSPLTPNIDLPHLQIPYPAAPSYSTPVSPITSAYPDLYYPHPQLHEPPPPPPQPKEPVVEYESPPPYDQIQWTVRVRQPRPRRT